MSRATAAALTAAAVLWAALIVVAPFAFHSHALAAPAAVVYAGASRICHQRPERSFEIAGWQMPVCARCSGLYVSGAAGALVAFLPWRKRTTAFVSSRNLLLLTALPTALTWTLEIVGVMPFSNTTRAIAALPLGAAAGWVFVRMLRYDSRLDGEQILYG